MEKLKLFVPNEQLSFPYTILVIEAVKDLEMQKL